MAARLRGGWADAEVGERGKRRRVFIIKEKILIPPAVARDVSIGSGCRATPERLAAQKKERKKKGGAWCRGVSPMYISEYASTFNSKFNIQTQKGTRIRRRAFAFPLFPWMLELQPWIFAWPGFIPQLFFMFYFLFFLHSSEFIFLIFFWSFLSVEEDWSCCCYEGFSSSFLTWKHPAGRVLG